MASYSSSPRFEVEISISSAKDLKNVNWRHGNLKPYAVVWVDPKSKYSTKVDEYGDTSPIWDEKLLIPFTSPIEDSTLSIDIVHANAHDDTKPLIGSTRVPLKDVLDDVGLGEYDNRTLKLKRPSGRPQGKLEVGIIVRESRYHAPDPYYAPPPPQPYGVPVPQTSRDYPAAQYGYPYAPPAPYQGGYPYNPSPYDQGSYGHQQPVYAEVQDQKKSSKFGMGTGLAVGAVAGVLGGLAIAEGVDYVEDKIADDVAERVEDDLEYDDGGFDGGDF